MDDVMCNVDRFDPDSFILPNMVWYIEDGGQHWVVAPSHEAACQVMADSMQETLELYMSEYEPQCAWCDQTKPIRINFAEEIPQHTIDSLPRMAKWQCYAEIMPIDAARNMTGIICTSEY